MGQLCGKGMRPRKLQALQTYFFEKISGGNKLNTEHVMVRFRLV